MRHEVQRARGQIGLAESDRFKQFFAEVFGPEVLSTLALRIEAVSATTRRRAAIEWTRQSLSRHARISYT